MLHPDNLGASYLPEKLMAVAMSSVSTRTEALRRRAANPFHRVHVRFPLLTPPRQDSDGGMVFFLVRPLSPTLLRLPLYPFDTITRASSPHSSHRRTSHPLYDENHGIAGHRTCLPQHAQDPAQSWMTSARTTTRGLASNAEVTRSASWKPDLAPTCGRVGSRNSARVPRHQSESDVSSPT